MVFRKSHSYCRAGAFALACLVISHSASAATVQEVSVADMLGGSELVVHGEVIDRWTGTGVDETQIYTYVRIQVFDAIKGTVPGGTIDIRFLGGRSGRYVLDISDQYVPPIGDEAVYFIENPSLNQVNPLYGWRQGHFPVRIDSATGQKLAMTFDLKPIFDVDRGAAVATAQFSKGVARGVSTKSSIDATPMTLSTFMARLSELAEVEK